MESESEELIDNRPSFFKIIPPLPGASELLRIPPEFIKNIEKDSSERSTLRGPSGCCWPMKICKDGKGLFLEDGWHQFFKAHSLGHFEVLVFTYDGEMCFDVRIYDKNGLERVNVSVAIPHQQDDSHESISVGHDSDEDMQCDESSQGPDEDIQCDEFSQGPDEDIQCDESSQLKECREEECSKKNIEVYVIESSDEEMNVQFKEYEDEMVNQRNEIKNAREGASNTEACQDAMQTTVKRKRGRPRKIPVGANLLGKGPGPQGHEPEQLNKSAGKEQSKIDMKKEINEVNEESDFLFKRLESLRINRPSSSRRSPPAEARDGILRKKPTFRSRFPFFQRCLEVRNFKRMYMFSIPLNFAKKYLPREKSRIRLRNEEGDSWDVNFIPHESSPVFSGGWPVFVRENGLKPGDLCVFELVKELVMKVYIQTSK